MALPLFPCWLPAAAAAAAAAQVWAVWGGSPQGAHASSCSVIRNSWGPQHHWRAGARGGERGSCGWQSLTWMVLVHLLVWGSC